MSARTSRIRPWTSSRVASAELLADQRGLGGVRGDRRLELAVQLLLRLERLLDLGDPIAGAPGRGIAKDGACTTVFGTRGSEVRILSLRPIKSIGWRCGRSVAEQFPNRLNVKRATASESIGRPTARHDGGGFTIHCAGQRYVLPDDLPDPLIDLGPRLDRPGRGQGAPGSPILPLI